MDEDSDRVSDSHCESSLKQTNKKRIHLVIQSVGFFLYYFMDPFDKAV